MIGIELVFNFQGTDIEEINIPVLKLSTRCTLDDFYRFKNLV